LIKAEEGTGPEYVGNCVSGKWDFANMDKERVIAIGQLPTGVRNIPNLDVGRYDFVINYNSDLLEFTDQGIRMVSCEWIHSRT